MDESETVRALLDLREQLWAGIKPEDYRKYVEALSVAIAIVRYHDAAKTRRSATERTDLDG